MLNETQHARSEDEAQEMEATMRAGWAVRLGAAFLLLLSSSVLALWIGFMMVLIGLTGCGATAHQPQKNTKSPMLGVADAERAEPADSTSLSTL